jgi:2-phosphoglycolate phosphatase
MTRIKSVLFDLDGTLLDTAADLGQALNDTLVKRQLEPLHLSKIRNNAGRGCRGLLKLGLDMENTHPEYAALCIELLDNYQRHMLTSTQLFPGMDAVLHHLEDNNIPWGIVTNKPHRFTQELIRHLKLETRAACVISGDTLAHSKPHPAPILHACQQIGLTAAHCLYVGDSEIDIIASRAAGSPSLVALYGYIIETENPETWNADGYIHHPHEILTWL